MNTLSRRDALSIVAGITGTGLLGVGNTLARAVQEDRPVTPEARRGMIETAAADNGPIVALLEDLARNGRFAGAALIAIDGRPLLRRVYGMADQGQGVENTFDTRFNIASMGKMFTAIAIGRLVQQGRLSFQDTVAQHLPDFPRDIAEQVTLHHLLTHTSGLGMYWSTPSYLRDRLSIRTVADYMAVLEPSLAFTPGERFAYSNSGYIVLGAVIEKVTGRDFYDHVRDEIFVPAGMTHSDYATLDQLTELYARANGGTGGGAHDPNRGGPAGGGYSTVDDLLKFQAALQAGQLVDADVLREMTTAHVTPPRPGPPPYGYGFGVEAPRGVRIVGHTGGTPGYGALLDMYLDVPATVALTTNLEGSLIAAARGIRPLLTATA